ncbi:hypothetical protein BOTCAL_0273g00060 [Botryotinia calthae]|uniref:Velvet domain-containing protein n=1 Tax=Botryotinia calthae TaxID=38488 RepID=A0A4Y8CVL5_9HELO|nr:hypothetical protein BOTCAL_0273g00060 [Botryotinia calthae]
MLSIAVQPPARVRPGSILYPPLIVQLSSEHDLYEHLAGYWTCVSLIHYATGQVIYEQMCGKAADSAHPIAQTRSRGVRDQAYFFFQDLAIHAPGRYRLKIRLIRNDYSPESGQDGAVICDDEVNTRSITVEESGPNYSRPNSQERAFIRMLRDDGQDVPTPAH